MIVTQLQSTRHTGRDGSEAAMLQNFPLGDQAIS
jgi:hypothetical protein